MESYDQLVERRNSLANMPIADLTVEQVRDRVNELNSLERQIQASAPVQPQYIYRQLENVPRFRIPTLPTMEQLQQTIHTAPKERKRLSERNIGRKVMTTLAAALCLLALTVFIASFWFFLPDPLKFLLFLGLGIGFEFLGVFMSNRSEEMRSFWTGIAGLGAGVTFIDIAAGTLFWYLYGIGLAGLLILFWVMANFFLGRKQESRVFYTIAYIGGLLTLVLGAWIAEVSFGSEIVAGLALAIAVLGLLEFYMFNRTQFLLVASMVYCVLSSLIVLSIPDSPAVVIYAVLASTACLFNVRYLTVGEKQFGVKQSVLTVYGFSMFLRYCALQPAIPLELGIVLALVAIMVARYKAKQGYLLGMVIPWSLLLSQLSAAVFSIAGEEGCSAMIPAAASLAVCILYYRLDDIYDKVAAWTLYGLSLIFLLGVPKEAQPLYYVIAWGLLMSGLATYTWFNNRYEAYTHEPLERVAVCAIPGVSLFCFVSLGYVPVILPLAGITLGLQLYWFLYARYIGEANLGAAFNVWNGLRVVTYSATLTVAALAKGNSVWILTASLLLTLAFNIYRAIVLDDKRQSFAACLMANAHMLIIVSAWGISIQQMPISIFGLLISAGFIVFGFMLYRNGARQAGLGCSVLYALKIGLLDIQSGGVGVAGGLLLAGVICFGISFAYNKLDARYNLDNSDSDTPV